MSATPGSSELDLSRIEIGEVTTKPVDKKAEEKKKPEKKKKRPTRYVASRYAKLPTTKVINKSIAYNINRRFLVGKVEQFKPTDTEIGEATSYLVEYYTMIDPYHPVLVIMGAIMGTGLKVMELQGGADTKGKDTQSSAFDEHVKMIEDVVA